MSATVVHQSQSYTITRPVPTVQPEPPASKSLNKAGALTGAIIQLVCSGLSVLFGVLAYKFEVCKYHSASPIWCGVLFFMPAGVLGVISAKQKSSFPIIGCMVMSILAAIMSVTPFSFSLAGALHEGDYCYCYQPDPYDDDYYYDWYDCYTMHGYEKNSENRTRNVSVNGILALVAVVEFLAAIYTSAVMCAGVTCCKDEQASTVTVVSSQIIPTTTQVIRTGYPNPGYQQLSPSPLYDEQAARAGYQPHPAGYQLMK